MAENKIEKLAELLGVEIDKPFNIKGYAFNPCKLTKTGMINNKKNITTVRLFQLLTGELEIEKPILSDSEKDYLENVLRPFKNRIMYVKKVASLGYECIRYRVHLPIKKYGDMTYELPYFDKGTMYKGMKTEEQYSLEELGLFEGDDE